MDYELTEPHDDIAGTQGAKRLNTYTAEYTLATNSRVIRDTEKVIASDVSTIKTNTDDVERMLTSVLEKLDTIIDLMQNK